MWKGNSMPGLESYEALVVSAGPAGSVASLGKKGFNVLLVDKTRFPRELARHNFWEGKDYSAPFWSRQNC